MTERGGKEQKDRTIKAADDERERGLSASGAKDVGMCCQRAASKTGILQQIDFEPLYCVDCFSSLVASGSMRISTGNQHRQRQRQWQRQGEWRR